MRILYLALALCLALPAGAERVCSVHDGDTLTLCDARKVRLFGVDAPELKQPGGIEARDYLRRLVDNREVGLHCVGKSYKRSVCAVTVHIGPEHLTPVLSWLDGASPTESRAMTKAATSMRKTSPES